MIIINNIIAAILLIVANFIEIYFFWIVCKHPECSYWSLFLAHFIASLVVVLALWVSRLKYIKEEEEKIEEEDQKPDFVVDKDELDIDEEGIEFVRHPLLLPSFSISFFIPIFGVLISSILAILIKPLDGRKSEVFREYIDYIRLNAAKRRRFSRIDVETEIFNKLEIEPVSDLLKTDRKEVVWGAVDNLSRRSDRISVGLIKNTMTQNDMDVKYLSSISLDKIESVLSKKIDHLKDKIEEECLEQDVLELMLTIDKLYCSGILPKELSYSLIKGNLAYVDKYFSGTISNIEIIAFRARFLKYMGKTKIALSYFDSLLKKDKLPNQFYLDVAELLANIGEIEKAALVVGQFTDDIKNQEVLNELASDLDLEDLRTFWLQSEAIDA